jgi:hypothetical protein
LRLYWDVRIVRGRDTSFARVTGTSNLPRALACNMVAIAPTRIQRAVLEKIMEPLTAIMQTEPERQTSEGIDAGPEADGPGSEAVDDPGIGGWD